MLCFKILVVFIVAQCRGHHIYLQKGLKIQQNGMPPNIPMNIFAYIHGKWTPFAEMETKSVIQKRESLSNGEILPLKAEVPPAPVIEHFEEKETLEAASSLFGFQRPEPSFNRVPLTRSVVQGLNTNIRESLPQTVNLNSPELLISGPQRAGELFEGLPPRPVETIPATGPVVERETVPLLVPPQNNPVPEEVVPPALFDRTRVRQYAVYAGDVILKYLSQFFNRARITFSRFTSPPPPTPIYEN